MTRVTEKVVNIKDVVNDLAAPKNHTHPQYLQNTSQTTYLTDAHTSVKATSSQLGHVMVDTEVKNSNNPVSNSAIKTYIDNNIPIITLDNTVTENSTNGVTSGAVYTAVNNIKYDINLAGLSPSKPDEMAISSLDDVDTPGSFKIGANIPMRNKSNIDTTNSVLTIYKMGNLYTHILSMPDGSEYRRHGYKNNNDGIVWDSWNLSYLPFQEYTIPLAGATYNNNVHDISIFQDTSGYTIRWNQTHNPNGNNQTYFTTHSTKYEYKHVVQFSKNLDIAGPYIFSNIVNATDIKIQPDGIYLRSTKASSQINDINETFFVPRVP